MTAYGYNMEMCSHTYPNTPDRDENSVVERNDTLLGRWFEKRLNPMTANPCQVPETNPKMLQMHPGVDHLS